MFRFAIRSASVGSQARRLQVPMRQPDFLRLVLPLVLGVLLITGGDIAFAQDRLLEHIALLVDNDEGKGYVLKSDGTTKVGPWEERKPDGIIESGSYSNGRRHGRWLSINKEGRTTAVATYLDGVLHGPYRSLAPGRPGLYEEGAMANGARSGFWIVPTREADEHCFHEAGRRHGPCYFASREQPSTLYAHFWDGARAGFSRRSDGIAVSLSQYAGGELHGAMTEWTRGTRTQALQYAYGRLHGPQVGRPGNDPREMQYFIHGTQVTSAEWAEVGPLMPSSFVGTVLPPTTITLDSPSDSAVREIASIGESGVGPHVLLSSAALGLAERRVAIEAGQIALTEYGDISLLDVSAEVRQALGRLTTQILDLSLDPAEIRRELATLTQAQHADTLHLARVAQFKYTKPGLLHLSPAEITAAYIAELQTALKTIEDIEYSPERVAALAHHGLVHFEALQVPTKGRFREERTFTPKDLSVVTNTASMWETLARRRDEFSALETMELQRLNPQRPMFERDMANELAQLYRSIAAALARPPRTVEYQSALGFMTRTSPEPRLESDACDYSTVDVAERASRWLKDFSAAQRQAFVALEQDPLTNSVAIARIRRTLRRSRLAEGQYRIRPWDDTSPSVVACDAYFNRVYEDLDAVSRTFRNELVTLYPWLFATVGGIPGSRVGRPIGGEKYPPEEVDIRQPEDLITWKQGVLAKIHAQARTKNLASDNYEMPNFKPDLLYVQAREAELAAADWRAYTEAIDEFEHTLDLRIAISSQAARLRMESASLKVVKESLRLTSERPLRVVGRHVSVGDSVAAGTPLVTVADPLERHLRVTIPPSDPLAGTLSVGVPVTVHLAHPEWTIPRSFSGTDLGFRADSPPSLLTSTLLNSLIVNGIVVSQDVDTTAEIVIRFELAPDELRRFVTLPQAIQEAKLSEADVRDPGQPYMVSTDRDLIPNLGFVRVTIWPSEPAVYIVLAEDVLRRSASVLESHRAKSKAH